MKGFEPRKPTGSDPESRFVQSVHDKTFGPESNLIDSSTVKIRKTTRGISFHAQRAKGGGSSPAQFKALHYKQSLGDYFLTMEGIAVAKDPKLRNSITTETIYTTRFDFSYPSNPVNGGPSSDPNAYLFRNVTLHNVLNSPLEKQGVVPQFLVNDLIFAVEVGDITGVVSDPLDTSMPPNTPITWLHFCTSRAWTRLSTQ